jgi:hypothetical protein
MIGEMHGTNPEIHFALSFFVVVHVHISCNARLACQYLTTLASRGVLESVSHCPGVLMISPVLVLIDLSILNRSFPLT